MLSTKLTTEYGKEFSQQNLERMLQFYLVYSKAQTLFAQFKNHQKASTTFQLNWSHHLKLMKIKDTDERKFYEIEFSRFITNIFAAYAWELPIANILVF